MMLIGGQPTSASAKSRLKRIFFRSAVSCPTLRLASTWIAGFRRPNEQSERRRLWLRRLRAEGPRRIPLGAVLGESELPCVLLVAHLLVLRAGQRRKKRH